MPKTKVDGLGAEIILMTDKKLSRREKIQQKLNLLLPELREYYGASLSGFVDDVAQAADGKTGIQGALLQIEWIESELDAYRQIDSGD